jgi:hypothetical protein
MRKLSAAFYTGGHLGEAHAKQAPAYLIYVPGSPDLRSLVDAAPLDVVERRDRPTVSGMVAWLMRRGLFRSGLDPDIP